MDGDGGRDTKEMDLPEQQDRHLHSVFAALGEYCRQIESLVSLGTPPPGANPELSPLPDEEARPLLEELKALQDCADKGLRSLSPERQRHRTQSEAIRSTLVWTSVLLGHVEELIKEFEPQYVARRYGQIPSEFARRLKMLHRELATRIAKCRSYVERWRLPGDGVGSS
jgi:hypothetical protein